MCADAGSFRWWESMAGVRNCKRRKKNPMCSRESRVAVTAKTTSASVLGRKSDETRLASPLRGRSGHDLGLAIRYAAPNAERKGRKWQFLKA